MNEPEWVQVMRDLVEYAHYLETYLFEDETEDLAVVAANALLAEFE